MSITEYDWRILNEKLYIFEERLKSLEKAVYDYTPKAYKISPSISTDSKKILGELLSQKCLFDGVDKSKPTGLSCSCPRCIAYAMNYKGE